MSWFEDVSSSDVGDGNGESCFFGHGFDVDVRDCYGCALAACADAARRACFLCGARAEGVWIYADACACVCFVCVARGSLEWDGKRDVFVLEWSYGSGERECGAASDCGFTVECDGCHVRYCLSSDRYLNYARVVAGEVEFVAGVAEFVRASVLEFYDDIEDALVVVDFCGGNVWGEVHEYALCTRDLLYALSVVAATSACGN